MLIFQFLSRNLKPRLINTALKQKNLNQFRELEKYSEWESIRPLDSFFTGPLLYQLSQFSLFRPRLAKGSVGRSTMYGWIPRNQLCIQHSIFIIVDPVWTKAIFYTSPYRVPCLSIQEGEVQSFNPLKLLRVLIPSYKIVSVEAACGSSGWQWT